MCWNVILLDAKAQPSLTIAAQCLLLASTSSLHAQPVTSVALGPMIAVQAAAQTRSHTQLSLTIPAFLRSQTVAPATTSPQCRKQNARDSPFQRAVLAKPGDTDVPQRRCYAAMCRSRSCTGYTVRLPQKQHLQRGMRAGVMEGRP